MAYEHDAFDVWCYSMDVYVDEGRRSLTAAEIAKRFSISKRTATRLLAQAAKEGWTTAGGRPKHMITELTAWANERN